MNIYDKFLTADGYVRSLMGLIKTPNYDEYGVDDIDKRLRSYNLLEKKIDDFKSKWTSTEGNARLKLYKDVQDYLQMIDIQKADIKVIEANNYFLSQRLYISDEIINILHLLRSELGSYVNSVDHMMKYNLHFTNESELRKSIEDNLIKLRIKTTEELKMGYYEGN